MEDYSANTDLSLYGPTAIPQAPSILVIHAARRTVNIADIICTLLGPEQRCGSATGQTILFNIP